MDATKSPAPRLARRKQPDIDPLGNATGSNPGPSPRDHERPDAPRGTTSAIEPELRGKPAKGSRLG